MRSLLWDCWRIKVSATSILMSSQSKANKKNSPILVVVDILQINEHLEEKLMLLEFKDLLRSRFLDPKVHYMTLLMPRVCSKIECMLQWNKSSPLATWLNTAEKLWNNNLLWWFHMIISLIRDKILRQKASGHLNWYIKINCTVHWLCICLSKEWPL